MTDNKKGSISRREFFTTVGVSSLGGLLFGTLIDTGKYMPGAGRKANKIITSLDSDYLAPGVEIKVGTTSGLYDGNTYSHHDSSVNIDLHKHASDYKRIERNVGSLIKLNSQDHQNLVDFVGNVAGPYTLVAAVGSVTNSTDKTPNDIDVLVLNGSDRAYDSPRALFDNQIEAISEDFRHAHYVEILNIVAKEDPQKAKEMKEILMSHSWRNDGKTESSSRHRMYGPLTADFFYLPKDEEMNFNGWKHVVYALGKEFEQINKPAKDLSPENPSKPIHLLTPNQAELESVTYNLKELDRAVNDGKATILYRGAMNKL